MILDQLNLQLFAGDSGDKTEKATSKKRQDAREKGQVLQSREISSSLVLLLVFASLKIFGGFMVDEISKYFVRAITEYPQWMENFDTGTVAIIFLDTILTMLKICAPIFGVALISGLASGYAQVGFLFTTKTLAFKFERINPLSGLKRIFSLRSITELLKAFFKITIVGYMAYAYINGEIINTLSLMDTTVLGIASYIASATIGLAIRICVALILLGVIDYGYQWWDYEKNLKMSKQEVKEEYKQIEGNPEVKSKIKQKQREISMRRMLHEVPKADVIITNPTHFAVAIQYDAQKSDAPLLIAKGQDFIAQRIKEVAKEHQIEIVENKPLARSIYDSVGIGEAIPPELYQAVAEVLAFVYSLKKSS